MFEIIVTWVDKIRESIICDSFVYRNDYKMCILSCQGRSRTLHLQDIDKISIKECL